MWGSSHNFDTGHKALMPGVTVKRLSRRKGMLAYYKVLVKKVYAVPEEYVYLYRYFHVEVSVGPPVPEPYAKTAKRSHPAPCRRIPAAAERYLAGFLCALAALHRPAVVRRHPPQNGNIAALVMGCDAKCRADGMFFDYVTRACGTCPFADRCRNGTCVTGSYGLGCGQCCAGLEESGCPEGVQYFKSHSNCVECTASNASWSWLVGGASVVAITALIWIVSRVRTTNGNVNNEAQQNFNDACGNVDDAQAVAELIQKLSNTALATSILIPYTQQLLHAMHLPFGLPIPLKQFAHWISGFLSIDL